MFCRPLFFYIFFLQSSKLSFDASEHFPQVTPVSDISYLVNPCKNCEGVVYTAAMNDSIPVGSFL